MTKVEKIAQLLPKLPEAEQLRVLAFAEFLNQEEYSAKEAALLERYQRAEIDIGELTDLIGLGDDWDAEAFAQQQAISL